MTKKNFFFHLFIISVIYIRKSYTWSKKKKKKIHPLIVLLRKVKQQTWIIIIFHWKFKTFNHMSKKKKIKIRMNIYFCIYANFNPKISLSIIYPIFFFFFVKYFHTVSFEMIIYNIIIYYFIFYENNLCDCWMRLFE